MRKSELKKQWEQELKRIQRIINKVKKQGIEFDYDPIPKEPKKITEKSIQRLKKIDIDSIKIKGKKVDEEPLKLKSKKNVYEPKKPRVQGSQEDIHISKGKRPPVLTEEQRKMRAKKAAQTRKEKAEKDPNYAKKVRETALANLEKAREVKRKKPEVKPDVTPEVKPDVTPEVKPDVTPEVKPDVTPEVKPEQFIGVDPITGEVLTEQDIKDREIDTKDELTDTQGAVEKPTQSKDEKKEKSTPYKELLKQRQEDRRALRQYIEEGDNIIDTIKEELKHAVNEEVADLVLTALEDVQDTFETPQERIAWLENINNSAQELLDRVYNLVDESDGEKVRTSVVHALIIIYGGFGNIPPTTLEYAEQLSNEIVGSKFQRRLLRAKKLRARYQ